MRSIAHKPLCACLCVCLTGCVPFVAPPVKIDMGAAARMADDSNDMTFLTRAGLDIIQLFPELHSRTFDVMPGWGAYPTIAGAFMHGPFLSAGILRPLTYDLIGQGWRWGFNLKGHYLLPQSLDSGFGVTAQGTIEYATYVNGRFAGGCGSDPSCALGVGLGEWAFGLFVEGSYAKLGDADVGWAGGGFIFRVPASLGIAITSIWD